MAKKKPTKKRVISKTEKKLKNQRRYQIEKRNKVRKDLNEAVKSLENLESEKIGKNVIYNIPDKIKKQLGIKRQTYKASKQTLINAYYQKIYKINNIVDEKEQALKRRFKFKQSGAITNQPRKKGELIFPVGFVWNVDSNIPEVLFNNSSIVSVENLIKKTHAPEILDLINEEKSKMTSKHFMSLIGKNEGNFRIYVQNLDEKPKKLKSLRKTYAKSN
jgi:hypothetical protein